MQFNIGILFSDLIAILGIYFTMSGINIKRYQHELTKLYVWSPSKDYYYTVGKFLNIRKNDEILRLLLYEYSILSLTKLLFGFFMIIQIVAILIIGLRVNTLEPLNWEALIVQNQPIEGWILILSFLFVMYTSLAIYVRKQVSSVQVNYKILSDYCKENINDNSKIQFK